MTAISTLQSAQDADRQSREQAKENQARPAFATLTYTTKGNGEFIAPAVLDFGVTFIEEPAFSHGAFISKIPNQTRWMFPRTEAAVLRWQRDNKTGFYTGAFMIYMVDVTSRLRRVPQEIPSAEVHHHLVFQGQAIKALPPKVMEQLASGEKSTSGHTFSSIVPARG